MWGVVHSLAATGGSGEYAYSRVAGPSTVVVDEASGMVSITVGLPIGDLTAVFAVQDGDGSSVWFTLNLEVDGSGAFAGYRDAMFLIGGNDGGQNKNDLWRSADGENWFPVSVSGEHFSGAVVASGGFLWGESLGDWGGRRWSE